ncbi:hypothetical protein Golomagni_07803, partial [Golovinomyces magnicellulatus]
QRRRGAGAATAAAGPSTSASRIDDDDYTPSRTGSPAPAGSSTPTRSAAGIPASAYGSRSATGSVTTYDESTGHRVAYDPRDLNDEREIGENPRLTLMEEILLLGLKDRQGYLSFWNDNISYTLRGCILIELALRRRIAITKDPMRKRFGLTERMVDVIDAKMTGEVLLDEALKMMKASERMSVAQWVDLMSGKRDVERDEDRVPAQAGARAAGQGAGGQGHPAHREAQLLAVRHGHASAQRHELQGCRVAAGAHASHLEFAQRARRHLLQGGCLVEWTTRCTARHACAVPALLLVFGQRARERAQPP